MLYHKDPLSNKQMSVRLFCCENCDTLIKSHLNNSNIFCLKSIFKAEPTFLAKFNEQSSFTMSCCHVKSNYNNPSFHFQVYRLELLDLNMRANSNNEYRNISVVLNLDNLNRRFLLNTLPRMN